jgi:Protein of unknown function (DUF3016)
MQSSGPGLALGFVLIASLALSASDAAAGQASVVFVHKEKFTDAGDAFQAHSLGDNLAELSRHCSELAKNKLPDGQTLSVEVLDVDLAGRSEPWHHRSGSEVRVMRSVTWPQIQMRYILRQGDQIIAQGEETVLDLNYLDYPNRYPDGDPLRYEKRMLDRWFQERLVELRPARR